MAHLGGRHDAAPRFALAQRAQQRKPRLLALAHLPPAAGECRAGSGRSQQARTPTPTRRRSSPNGYRPRDQCQACNAAHRRERGLAHGGSPVRVRVKESTCEPANAVGVVGGRQRRRRVSSHPLATGGWMPSKPGMGAVHDTMQLRAQPGQRAPGASCRGPPPNSRLLACVTALIEPDRRELAAQSVESSLSTRQAAHLLPVPTHQHQQSQLTRIWS